MFLFPGMLLRPRHPPEVTMHAIRTALLAAIIVVPAWAATAPPVAADTWPQYRGANRDGISTEKLAFGSTPPEIAWKAKLGIGFSSLAIAGGLVYASGNDGAKDTLQCLEAQTGK